MFNAKNVNAGQKKCMNVVVIEREQKSELSDYGTGALAVARSRRRDKIE